MQAKDDNLLEEAASLLLSMTQVEGAAKEPTEDMPAKVDAIPWPGTWQETTF